MLVLGSVLIVFCFLLLVDHDKDGAVRLVSLLRRADVQWDVCILSYMSFVFRFG